MGSEVVVFDHASPVRVINAWSLVAGSDAVFPMVFIGKAASGPAEDGEVEIL